MPPLLHSRLLKFRWRRADSSRMIAALLVLVPLSAAAVWLYLRTAPATSRRVFLGAYNVVVILVVAGLSTTLVLHVRALLGTGPDRAWWPVLGGLGALALVPVLLCIAGMLRNFVLFRRGAPTT